MKSRPCKNYKFYFDGEYITSEIGVDKDEALKKARMRFWSSSSPVADTMLSLLNKSDRVVYEDCEVTLV